MSLVSLALFSVPSAAFRHSVSQVLVREFPRDQVTRIWREARRQQSQLRSLRPRHSFGVNRVLRYFEWDCALFLAMKQEGLPAETAGGFVEEINWAVFGPAFALTYSSTRLRSKKLRPRVQLMLDVMFSVLFTSPFERTKVPSRQDVAFNVTICPLAQYFRDCGVPELTSYAACSLDYRMAKNWGVQLVRTQTIAAGDRLCDFRFQMDQPSGSVDRQQIAEGSAASRSSNSSLSISGTIESQEK